MRRVNNATAGANVNGTGKSGYIDESHNVSTNQRTPGTIIDSYAMNAIQEELCNLAQINNAALSSSNDQCRSEVSSYISTTALTNATTWKQALVEQELFRRLSAPTGSSSAYSASNMAIYGMKIINASTSPSGSSKTTNEILTCVGVHSSQNRMIVSTDLGYSFYSISGLPNLNWSSCCLYMTGGSTVTSAIIATTADGSGRYVYTGFPLSPGIPFASASGSNLSGTWSAIESNGTNRIRAVASGGSNRAMGSSNSGASFSAESIPTASYQGIAYASSIDTWCAVASSGSASVAYVQGSGTTWSASSVAGNFQSIAWSDDLGLFCIVNSSSPYDAYTSPDGISWTRRKDSTIVGAEIYYLKNMKCFLIRSSVSSTFLYSFDGISWKQSRKNLDSGNSKLIQFKNSSAMFAINFVSGQTLSEMG